MSELDLKQGTKERDVDEAEGKQAQRPRPALSTPSGGAQTSTSDITGQEVTPGIVAPESQDSVLIDNKTLQVAPLESGPAGALDLPLSDSAASDPPRTRAVDASMPQITSFLSSSASPLVAPSLLKQLSLTPFALKGDMPHVLAYMFSPTKLNQPSTQSRWS